MPRKIRELVQLLRKAGFVLRRGRGSHRNLKHPSGVRITISGQVGDDAKPYQERDVAKALREAKGEG